jgi:hypothetical protein
MKYIKSISEILVSQAALLHVADQSFRNSNVMHVAAIICLSPGLRAMFARPLDFFSFIVQLPVVVGNRKSTSRQNQSRN